MRLAAIYKFSSASLWLHCGSRVGRGGILGANGSASSRRACLFYANFRGDSCAIMYSSKARVRTMGGPSTRACRGWLGWHSRQEGGCQRISSTTSRLSGFTPQCKQRPLALWCITWTSRAGLHGKSSAGHPPLSCDSRSLPCQRQGAGPLLTSSLLQNLARPWPSCPRRWYWRWRCPMPPTHASTACLSAQLCWRSQSQHWPSSRVCAAQRTRRDAACAACVQSTSCARLMRAPQARVLSLPRESSRRGNEMVAQVALCQLASPTCGRCWGTSQGGAEAVKSLPLPTLAGSHYSHRDATALVLVAVPQSLTLQLSLYILEHRRHQQQNCKAMDAQSLPRATRRLWRNHLIYHL
jgi:hypothetical protein